MENNDEQTYLIIGAAMEVHKQLGHGFLEAVYQEAFARELEIRNIPFQKECSFPIVYKNVTLACSYRADFVCFDEIIVELKALAGTGTNEQAQVINYLKASGMTRGLLINFGAPTLQYKRLVY